MKYRPNRGGHAPGHLREAFQSWLNSDREETVEIDEKTVPLHRLIGQLWNCTDILPGEYCQSLDLVRGSTYAQVVRKVALGLS